MAVFRYKMQSILDIKEKLEDKAKQDFAALASLVKGRGNCIGAGAFIWTRASS